MSSAANVSLELDDIQRGVLQQRPSPTSAPTSSFASTSERRDASWFGDCCRRSPRPLVCQPDRDASVSVAFTYRGLEALGVPQESLDSFAPEFRQGMSARATELGDSGDSAPHNWEKPLGTSEVHVVVAALSRDSDGWRRCSSGPAGRTRSYPE